MGEIGNLGDVSFVVESAKKGIKILSFSDLRRESEARLVEHESKSELLEFDGPGLDELTLTITAKAQYRVKPQTVQNKLHKYRKAGKRLTFVLGGKKVGYGFYAIKNISQSYEEITANGQVASMTFDLTLKQYPKTTSKKKKSKNSSKGSTSTKKEKGKTTSATGYQTYEVKKGDTLWSIAKKFYGKGSAYTKIFNANKSAIKNPKMIYAGQKLKIPK